MSYIFSDWTEEEDAVLVENFYDLSYEEIGLKLGRSKDACYRRAKQLGLKKPRGRRPSK